MDVHHRQPVLPPEIWLHILHIAVQPDEHPRADEHEPFQPVPQQQLGPHVKLAALLVRVCRAWHSLLLSALYKDVELGGDTIILLPQHVRRVVLPYAFTAQATHHDPAVAVEHLRQCTQVEILCRPLEASIEDICAGPRAIPLPSLQRLEWWQGAHIDRSGGINALVDVLAQCPNLRYLLVVGRPGGIPLDHATGVCLPALETLRLRYLNGYFLFQMLRGWSLPALKTVILDLPPVNANLSLFWHKFGANLTRVELGKDIRFLMNDRLSDCLHGCPVLEEICFYFLFTAPPKTVSTISRSLRRVRIHAADNHAVWKSERWVMLHGHFKALNHSGMEKLTTFILHGDWDPYVNDPRWRTIRERVAAQNRWLVLQREYDRIVS